MGEQRDPAALEALLQRAIFKQPVDAEVQASSSANASAWWKSGLPSACLSAQYESTPLTSSITTEMPMRRQPCATAMDACSSSSLEDTRTAMRGSGMASAPPSRYRLKA